jgi:hypothetical protein
MRPAKASRSLAISAPVMSFTDTVSPMPRKKRVTALDFLLPIDASSAPVITVVCSNPANCE